MIRRNDVTRRKLLATATATATLLAWQGMPKAWAAGTIKVGFTGPLSGSLSLLAKRP